MCPHAGATLSEGEVEGSIVTCPRHGSQFDVCTGERVRGPADEGLRTMRVVEEDGFVHLLTDE
jgi:nitrite reductase/ring-hydroxylating ferredoxin subunit